MDQTLLGSSSQVLQTIRRWVIFTLLVTVVTLAFTISSMVFALQARNRKESPSPSSDESSEVVNLPYRYVIDDAYIMPPTDQKNIGTCWCFATIYLLESQYRAQGIRQGLLYPEEYVLFSVQAWLKFLHDHCLAHPEVKACHYGGLLHNESADQEIETLYYIYNAFEDASTSLLPNQTCPYPPAPPPGTPNWDWFKCEGYDSALKSNPIKWSIKSLSMAYTTQGVKELLFKAKRALGIGAPLPNMVYYVPCKEYPFQGSPECLSRTVPCPEYVAGDYCAKVTLDGRDYDGVFLASVDPKYMGELGGHAMNVVGWNDDWIYRNRFQSAEASAQLKGGFILHNSWRGNGHSVSYFFGNQSEENEAVICPNHATPVNWIPALYEEVVNLSKITRFTNLSALKIVQERVRGRGRTKGADLLYSSYYPNLRFALAQDPATGDADVKFLPSGLAEVGLIQINTSTFPYTVTRINLSSFPFWTLNKYFAPVPETLVPNEWDSCGYWMLPYLTLENMQRINWDLLDNFRVIDLEIEFAEQSYSRHPDSRNYNTSLLDRSRFIKNVTQFDGPLPYQYIY